MGIELGLQRVSQLAKVLGNPQKAQWAVHVAGTNGKGSVCSYVAGALRASGFKTGKFTSPHLKVRWDCISINGKAVREQEFLDLEDHVKKTNEKYNLKCTEFETLTMTAFEIFKRENVDFTVIEVGLGGRLDATNILEPPIGEEKGVLATGITKIGLDHEGILGVTLLEIAYQKAGIMKNNTPCVLDGTNHVDCIKVFVEEAQVHNVLLNLTSDEPTKFGPVTSFQTPLLGEYQTANLSVALGILNSLSEKFSQITKETVSSGIKLIEWPGRLQRIDLKYSSDKPSVPVLIDGAHNGSLAIELQKYLSRTKKGPITYIMAITEGKTLQPLVSPLVSKSDTVVITKFSPVDGMPWIKCYEPEVLKDEFSQYTDNVVVSNSLPEALNAACESGNEIVICGSLYLIADVLRL